MNRCERKKRAADLYAALGAVRTTLLQAQSGEEAKTDKALKILRPEMACLEHQIAILRLLQAEDRLMQYLWRAVFGVIGAVVGALSHHVLPNNLLG